jgi:hypothetical protein
MTSLFEQPQRINITKIKNMNPLLMKMLHRRFCLKQKNSGLGRFVPVSERLDLTGF